MQNIEKNAFCSECELEIAPDAISIECVFCLNNYHAMKNKNCSNVNEMELKAILNKHSQIVFRCKNCKNNKATTHVYEDSSAVMQMLKTLQVSVNQIAESSLAFKKFSTDELPSIRKDISCMKTSIVELQSKLSAIETSSSIVTSDNDNSAAVVQSNKSFVNSISTSDVQNALGEIQERKKRENNLVIFNVPEDEEENEVAGIKIHETVEVLLEDFKLGTNFDVTNVKRVGKKTVDKIRPIIVVMDTRQDVTKVTSNWEKLPKHIRVSFDQTTNQRQEFKKLKKQADLFNKSASGDCFKVVRFKHGNPTLFTINKKSKTSINLAKVPSVDKVKNA